MLPAFALRAFASVTQATRATKKTNAFAVRSLMVTEPCSPLFVTHHRDMARMFPGSPGAGREVRAHGKSAHLPTTSTSNVPGTMVGRGCGCSGVGAGAGPYRAVTR